MFKLWISPSKTTTEVDPNSPTVLFKRKQFKETSLNGRNKPHTHWKCGHRWARRLFLGGFSVFSTSWTGKGLQRLLHAWHHLVRTNFILLSSSPAPTHNRENNEQVGILQLRGICGCLCHVRRAGNHSHIRCSLFSQEHCVNRKGSLSPCYKQINRKKRKGISKSSRRKNQHIVLL